MSDSIPPIPSPPSPPPPPPGRYIQEPDRPNRLLPIIKWGAFLLCGFAIVALFRPSFSGNEEIKQWHTNHIPEITHPDYPMPPDSVIQAGLDADEAERNSHTFQSNTSDEDSKADASKDESFIDVTKIAKKSKSVVDKLLGKPQSHEVTNPSNTPCPCDKYTYMNGSVEIVFINGKADWITVNNLGAHYYNPSDALTALGITPYRSPNESDDSAISWYAFNGYQLLRVFPNGSTGIDYAYIKAVTN